MGLVLEVNGSSTVMVQIRGSDVVLSAKLEKLSQEIKKLGEQLAKEK